MSIFKESTIFSGSTPPVNDLPPGFVSAEAFKAKQQTGGTAQPPAPELPEGFISAEEFSRLNAKKLEESRQFGLAEAAAADSTGVAVDLPPGYQNKEPWEEKDGPGLLVRWINWHNNFQQGFAETLIQGGLQGIPAFVGTKIGNAFWEWTSGEEATVNMEDLDLWKAGDDAMKLFAAANPTLPEQQDWIAGLARGAGNLAAMAGVGVATGGAAVPAVFGGGQMATQEYELAKESGASQGEADAIFLINTALGATDAIPISSALKVLNGTRVGSLIASRAVREAFKQSGLKGARQMGLEAARRVGVGIAKQGATEGFQEWYQELGSGLAANSIYGATRDLLEAPIQAGIYGFVLGSFMGGFTTGLRAQIAGAQSLEDVADIEAAISWAEGQKGDTINPPNLLGGSIFTGKPKVVKVMSVVADYLRYTRDPSGIPEAAYANRMIGFHKRFGQEYDAVLEQQLRNEGFEEQADQVNQRRRLLDLQSFSRIGYGIMQSDNQATQLVENMAADYKKKYESQPDEVFDKRIEAVEFALLQGRRPKRVPLGAQTIKGEIGNTGPIRAEDLEAVHRRLITESWEAVQEFERRLDELQKKDPNADFTTSRVLARTFMTRFTGHGMVSFEGIQLSDDPIARGREIALLAQLGRDPQVEWHNQLLLDKDNRILGHRRVGYKAPGATHGTTSAAGEFVLPGKVKADMDAYLQRTARAYKVNAKDLRFAIWHNHPNADNVPSQADFDFNNTLRQIYGDRIVADFVTDHGTIYFHAPNGEARKVDLNLPYTDPFLDPEFDHETLGTIFEPRDAVKLLEVAHRFQDQGYEVGNGTMMVFNISWGPETQPSVWRSSRHQGTSLPVKGRIIGVHQIRIDGLSDKQLIAHLRKMQKEGSGDLIVYGAPTHSQANLDPQLGIDRQRLWFLAANMDGVQVLDINGTAYPAGMGWPFQNPASVIGDIINKAGIEANPRGLHTLVPERGAPSFKRRLHGVPVTFKMDGGGGSGGMVSAFDPDGNAVGTLTFGQTEVVDNPLARPGVVSPTQTVRNRQKKVLNTGTKVIQIGNARVDTDWRGKGLGQHMYGMLLDLAKKDGAILVSDQTNTFGDEGSVRFYMGPQGFVNQGWKVVMNEGSYTDPATGNLKAPIGEPNFVVFPEDFDVVSRTGLPSGADPLFWRNFNIGITENRQTVEGVAFEPLRSPRPRAQTPTSQINPNQPLVVHTRMRDWWARFKRWMDPSQAVPKDIWQRYEITKAKIASELLEVDQNMDAFFNILRKDFFGKDSNRNIKYFVASKEAYAVPEEVWSAANMVLDGALPEAPMGTSDTAAGIQIRARLRAKALGEHNNAVTFTDPRQVLSEEAIGRLKNMRDQIDGLSRRLLAAGFINQRLKQKISQNLMGQAGHYGGTYVHRSYMKNLTKNWEKLVDPAVRARAHQFIKQAYANRRRNPLQLSDAQVDGIIRTILTEKDTEKKLLRNRARIGRVPVGPLLKRGDISPEIRALMGEITNPAARYHQTVSHLAQIVHNGFFFEDILRNFKGQYFFKGPLDPDYKEGFDKPIGSLGDVALGQLGGWTTSPEIAKAFHDVYRQIPKQAFDITVMLARANAASKYGKVIGSLQTQLRNLWGGAMMITAQGHIPFKGEFKKGWDAWRQIALGRPGDAQLEQVLRRMAELGLMGEGARAGELRRVARHAQLGESNLFSSKLAFITGDSKVPMSARMNYFVNRPVDFYQATDVYFRVGYFFAEMERYRNTSLGRSMTEAELEEHVADIVKNTYQNYDKVPERVRKLSTFPIFGTFVSFPTEMIRTTINTFQQARKELNSGQKDLRWIGAQRFMGLAATMGLSTVASVVAGLMLGIDREEDKDIKRFVAPWDTNSGLVYIDRTHTKVRYINFDYINPFGMFTEPIYALARGNEPTFFRKLGSAFQSTFEPFYAEEVFTKKFREALQNERDTGSRIYNPAESLGWKSAKFLGHLFTALEPGTLTQARRTYLAATGQKRRSGVPYSLRDEIFATFGFRASEVIITNSLRYRALDFNAEALDASRLYTESVYKKQDASKRRQALRDANEAYRATFYEMREDVRAARRLGLSWTTIKRVLKDNRVSQDRIDQLVRGVPSSIKPSTTR